MSAKEQQTVGYDHSIQLNVLIHLSGTRITKCAEGFSNKEFILTMDNGSEVFAKIPNLIAGPARLTIASEVVTRELVRQYGSLLTIGL